MRVGLISCTKSKTPYAAPARELYSPSHLFRGALAYLTDRADVIYVLSAKYGLLPLDEVAEPYDLTLKDAAPAYRREWARGVLADLTARHGPSLVGVTFEFHAGEAYTTELWPLLEQAGATCMSPVEGLTIGGRLGFYASRTTNQVAAAKAPAPSIATGMKIHAEIWLAAALLHDGGLATFTPSRLIREVQERFSDTRPGVSVHIHAHCIANAPKNTTVEYSYLTRTERGELRLWRRGDPLHPTRSGRRTAPDQTDIPEQYWDVWRRWQS